MAYRSLAEFLEELDAAGELARVGAEVDSALEIAEITDRVSRAGGPALLFQQVRGHAMPVVTNLLGTEARLCRALGIASLEELTDRVAAIVHPPAASEGWFASLRPAPDYAALAKLPPKTVKAGPCQQVVRLASDVDLDELPALKCRPLEAGHSLPRARLFSRSAETGARHVGAYDLAPLDKNRLAVLWHAPQAGPGLLAEYARKRERMPAAVVLGGDPAYDLATAAPLPPEVDPLLFAGLLRGKSIDLVRCRACEVEVPADAELVIEGYLDPAEPPVEVGPWAAVTGFYGPPCPAPVLHVTAMTHRANPVFPA
ncbi:MAG: UbiD family decarboxylase domain-containing protein, partial [Pirellulales bacterium]